MLRTSTSLPGTTLLPGTSPIIGPSTLASECLKQGSKTFNLTRYVEYGLPFNILSLLFQFAGSGAKLPDLIIEDKANFNKGCMDCYFGNIAHLMGEKSLFSFPKVAIHFGN